MSGSSLRVFRRKQATKGEMMMMKESEGEFETDRTTQRRNLVFHPRQENFKGRKKLGFKAQKENRKHSSPHHRLFHTFNRLRFKLN